MTPKRPLLLVVALFGCTLDRAAAQAASTEESADPSAVVAELPAQTSIYYNARIALRQGRHQDVLRLWLLRNALKSKGEVPTHDSDFRSALWAALAGAGLCQDGIRADDDANGAGLWPLALHNWLTRSSSKREALEQPRTFTSFRSGFQQRRISLYDVLSAEELRGTRFVRGNCLRPYFTLLQLRTPHWLDLHDRLSTGIVMRDLLVLSQHSLNVDRVRGQVVIETRLFDLDVALAKLARAKARRESGLLAQLAKLTGVSESALTLHRERRFAELRKSEYTELLRRCLRWDAEDWLSLSPDRRLALYAETALTYGDDAKMKQDLDNTLLLIIDALIERQDGKGLSQWLGFAQRQTVGGESPLLTRITSGARGEKLLSLGVETGFHERSAIALRRGIEDLTKGRSLDAMRSFALAMRHSDESSQATDVHNLARRWFAYVLAQHQASDEVLALLNTFVSPLDRNQLLEVLLWRAAFHADSTSFERIASWVKKGGSLDLRVQQLRSLAKGDAGAMWQRTLELHAEQPNAIFFFVKRVTEELATEPLDVRIRNRATLELGLSLLNTILAHSNSGLQRRIAEQHERIQTLLDGLDVRDDSALGKARAAAPGAEAYAGSVRLAPADPLPWPIPVPQAIAPSPFSPIELTPVEWIDEHGKRVFGWHIHEPERQQ